MTEYNDRIGDLMTKIRVNAVHLVDAFGWLDQSLCKFSSFYFYLIYFDLNLTNTTGSALGAYDGRSYERLLEFAKNSKFNEKEIHEAYYKYQKPYADKLARHNSKL
jgi:hypothetical protein